MHIFLHILYVTNIEKPVRSGADTKEKCMDYKKMIDDLLRKATKEQLRAIYYILVGFLGNS